MAAAVRLAEAGIETFITTSPISLLRADRGLPRGGGTFRGRRSDLASDTGRGEAAGERESGFGSKDARNARILRVDAFLFLVQTCSVFSY